MFIGLLPSALRNIRDDGRKIEEIIAALEAHDVQILQKHVFVANSEPICFWQLALAQFGGLMWPTLGTLSLRG